jgi:hypothetical protein
MRQYIDVNTLFELERVFHLENSWCEFCQEADLGIVEPELYIENEKKHIAGKCAVCGQTCESEITENQSEGFALRKLIKSRCCRTISTQLR